MELPKALTAHDLRSVSGGDFEASRDRASIDPTGFPQQPLAISKAIQGTSGARIRILLQNKVWTAVSVTTNNSPQTHGRRAIAPRKRYRLTSASR